MGYSLLGLGQGQGVGGRVDHFDGLGKEHPTAVHSGVPDELGGAHCRELAGMLDRGQQHPQHHQIETGLERGDDPRQCRVSQRVAT